MTDTHLAIGMRISRGVDYPRFDSAGHRITHVTVQLLPARLLPGQLILPGITDLSMPFDIEQLMDGSRLSPLHWRVLVLCALAAFLDGYDVAVMASATPSIAHAWHVNPGELRWVATAAVFGIAVSALIVSPLGDYFG